MISTNVHLEDEVKQLLIKAAAIKKTSIESLASEIINKAIREECNVIIDDAIPQEIKPDLADTQPYEFLCSPEESGIPESEWDDVVNFQD